MEKYIAFDIGGTKVKHSLILEDGTILSKSEYPTERVHLEIFLKNMEEVIAFYQKGNDIKGIAVSLPGFIDIHTGFSETAGAIVALQGKNLKEILESRVKLPVEIENDGNCAAIAEKVSGNAQDSDHFVCITIGTGIGGGIFINGEIFRGHHFKGGEFGFMIVQRQGREYFDMHQTASVPCLLDRYKKYKNIQDFIEGYQVFEEAKNDPNVEKIIKEWIEQLCIGIYNLTMTLNPEKILIGGGVSAQPLLIEEINSCLEKFERWKDFKVPVVACKYRNDAGMIGALYHLLKMRQKRKK